MQRGSVHNWFTSTSSFFQSCCEVVLSVKLTTWLLLYLQITWFTISYVNDWLIIVYFSYLDLEIKLFRCLLLSDVRAVLLMFFIGRLFDICAVWCLFWLGYYYYCRCCSCEEFLRWMFLTSFCCFGSWVRGRLDVGLCVYSDRLFRKTKVLWIVCFSSLGLLLLLLCCRSQNYFRCWRCMVALTTVVVSSSYQSTS